MHKLKRAARYQSWYPDEDGQTTFNPFSKARNPRNRTSLGGIDENNLSRTQSEGNTLNSAEKKRKSEYAGPNAPHYQTMPEHIQDGESSRIGGLTSSDSPDSEKEIEKDATEPLDNGTSTRELPDDTVHANGQHLALENGKPTHNSHLPAFLRNRKKPKDVESQANSNDSEIESKKLQKFTLWSQVRYSLFNSWINVLIICAPIGIALHFAKVSPIVIFVVNFIAIIPLAGTLSYATEEIALRTGETIGGLLNATFGNAVELIVSIIALFASPPQILIVQTSLIGSMLSNLLLVMGMCFFFGGLNRVEQHFNQTVAQTATSLLALAIGSLILPTAFNRYADIPGTADDTTLSNLITSISRGTAILLLLVYGCYLYFQLSTHVHIYNEPSKKSPKRRQKLARGDANKGMVQAMAGISATGAGATTSDQIQENANAPKEEDKEEPQLTLIAALVTLAWTTVLIALCAEFMVDAINEVVTETGVSRTFIGLILLPIVGNAAEHATAVTVAAKDKMDLAIGVAVGSSMQIALLVLPLVVTIGWIAHIDDMNFNFDPFEVIVLFVSVLLVNYLIADGKSHWLEGVLLQTLYLIIALAAWFFPNAATPLTEG